MRGLAQSTGDVAIGFFLLRYIKGSHFEYLPLLYNTASAGKALSASVLAAALASLSHETSCLETMRAARNQYSRALVATNSALQSPRESIQDETLASILLLSLFETIAHENQKSHDGWIAHIKGAVALLKLRGLQQLQTSLGRELFKQVSSNVRVSCVQRAIRVPAEFLEFHARAAAFLDGSDPVLRFSPISTAFAGLRAAMSEGKLRDPIAMTESAMQLDKETLLLSTSLPPTWQYDIMFTTTHSARVYGTQYHVYGDHRVAQLWNTIRMTRVLLNEIIYWQATKACSKLACGSLTSDWTILRALAADNVMKMAAEICASVPQFTQCPLPGMTTTPHSVASGSFLIWPLSIAGGSSLSPGSLCAYAADSLRFIGNENKVPQALDAARKLEQSKPLQGP